MSDGYERLSACRGPECRRDSVVVAPTFLCMAHYMQWRGRGDLGALTPLRAYVRQGGVCEVEECGETTWRGVLCQYHYVRAQKGYAVWPSCVRCGRERRNRSKRRLCTACLAASS